MSTFHRMVHKGSALCFVLALCCLPLSIHAKDRHKHKKAGVGYEAEIDYPIFKSEPTLNTQLAAIVRQNLENFNKTFFSAETSADPQVFEFNIESSSVYEDTHHISFLLNVYRFTGGAHGTTSLIPITYGKQTKKLLSLEEAMQPTRKDWLSVLSTEARKQLNKLVQKGKLSSDNDWITKGTEPDPENFAVFKLEKDSVRIIFSQYQVGPYSSGMPEIVVPRTLFK